MKTTAPPEAIGFTIDGSQKAKRKILSVGGHMKRLLIYGLLLYSLTALSLHAGTIAILGDASTFAVLAYSKVENRAGATLIVGDLGLYPAAATFITGFPPGSVTGATHAADAVALAARSAAEAAYTTLGGLPVTQDLSATPDLTGMILNPGVYFFSSAAQLTGTVTLRTGGDPNALFVFQIVSSLITSPGSKVAIDGVADCCNIYWKVGSSATLDTTTDFRGTIIALTSITLNNGATIRDGAALALNGAVTLDTNTISNFDCVPEPGTVALLGAGLFGLVLLRRTSGKRTA